MLTIFRTIYGLLAAAKTLQLMFSASVSTTGDASISPDALIAIPVGLAMIIAALFLIQGKATRATSLVIGLGFGTFILVLGFYNHHTYLLTVIAAIFAIGTHVVLLLKLQMSVVYFYAAVTKINETYLSGTELYASMVGRTFWQNLIGIDPAPWFLIGIASLSILVEGFLAFGFWFARTRWAALIIGVGFHLVLIILMTVDVHPSGINLIIYGFTLMSFYVLFFPRQSEYLYSRLMRARKGRHVTTRTHDIAEHPTS